MESKSEPQEGGLPSFLLCSSFRRDTTNTITSPSNLSATTGVVLGFSLLACRIYANEKGFLTGSWLLLATCNEFPGKGLRSLQAVEMICRPFSAGTGADENQQKTSEDERKQK